MWPHFNVALAEQMYFITGRVVEVSLLLCEAYSIGAPNAEVFGGMQILSEGLHGQMHLPSTKDLHTARTSALVAPMLYASHESKLTT